MSAADARLTEARAAISAAVLDALPSARLGDIELWPAQRRIVARARRALERNGGCLIAEDVGRGKTFIALALAREWRRRLVIAPASLRSTWDGAMSRAGVHCAFASHESLSRGRAPESDMDVIIVDESHHYRTLGTRRYEALINAAATVPVVLLSATPLQNRRTDLATQLAVFLGEAAFLLDDAAMSRFVIRGAEWPLERFPRVSAPVWVTPAVDDSRVLCAILDLPAPPGPLDAGDGGVLRTISLVRAWSSSRAALEETLRSRMRVAAAMEQGADAGRLPTRKELRAWTGGGDAVQLGFASLLMDARAGEGGVEHLCISLATEQDGIERLRALMRSTHDPDAARAATLRVLRTRHEGRRLLVFSERAATVRALYALMSREPGVGMLTSRMARIASGSIARSELLARFAPLAQGARVAPAHDAVTMLITTDLLSEGVNLQDASVVVHLDLPWNPARLQQRVGRVRRPGGSAEVSSYMLAPPATAMTLVDAESMLRRKLRDAERVLGNAITVLPRLCAPNGASTPSSLDGDDAATFGAMLETLERWTNPSHAEARVQAAVTAVVRSAHRGWIGALSDGRLLCSLDGEVHQHSRALWQACELAEGTAMEPDPVEIAKARRDLDAWLDREHIADACGSTASFGPLRRRLDAWISRCAATVSRHDRSAAFTNAAQLRQALRGPLPLFVERRLAALVSVSGECASTLRECAAVLNCGVQRRLPDTAHRPRVVGLVLFGRGAADSQQNGAGHSSE